MIHRSTFTAFARAVNAAFFLATSAYCILSYSSFAYYQFIRPEVFAWPGDFVILHHVLYWLCLLITALTLVPHLRSHRASAALSARLYLGISAAVGVWLVVNPFMETVGFSSSSLVAGLTALVFPASLALVDHLTVRPREIAVSDERRLFRACVVTSLIVWAVYAIAAPFRLRIAAGIDLPVAGVLVGLGASGLAHAMVFTGIFLVLTLLVGIGRRTGADGAVEYRLIVAAVAVTLALVLKGMAFSAVAFAGASAWISAWALAVAIALTWSGVARHRAADRDGELDAFDAALSPLYVGSSALRWGALVGLPVAAFTLATALERFDWDFLLQKLSVLVVWLVAFSLVYTMVRTDAPGRPDERAISPYRTVAAAAALLAVYWAAVGTAPRVMALTGDARLNTEVVLDRYAAVDPSLHFIQDATRASSGEAVAFYSYLKAHTTIAHVKVNPIEIDFVKPLGPPPGERPHIFFFVLDSLRRDYVQPYNKAVTFTPAIEAFARDAAVFERAFTRYGATGLSVPAMWIGGMTLHMQYITPFMPMNALLKLLDAGGYRRIMGIDSIATRMLAPTPLLTELDKGRLTMHYDFCRTMGELQQKLDESVSDPRPIFGYTLPQNVHIAISFQTPVPDGESYPGFFERVAAQVRRIDRCFGGFVGHLKRLGLYDRSIIVLTSDHGDSLGEEGRFGHSYTLFPEVMRVPLIIKLPASMAGAATDLTRVSFTTDITPTLYALLGYEPEALGPLYGAPLFGKTPDEDARRRDPFLLSSSYGAVYGMLRHNGRALYIADAVEGRDYAYDLSDGGLGHRVQITDAMRELNWRLIREEVARIADQYNFNPEP
jgi:hypothetical protein